MDFKEELQAAANKCVEDQSTSTEHLVRQSFYAGVGWYMAWLRAKAAEPPTPPSVS